MTKTEQDKKVKLFNELRDLTYNDLQYKCIRLGLDHEGNGDRMILVRRLVNSALISQNTTAPQAFAVKSDANEEAQEFARAANARILQQDPTTGQVIRTKLFQKPFKMTDKLGNQYEVRCPFVPAKNETVKLMATKGWLSPLETQYELLNMLKETPEAFSCNLIRKRTGTDGRWYLMLHVQKKEQSEQAIS